MPTTGPGRLAEGNDWRSCRYGEPLDEADLRWSSCPLQAEGLMAAQTMYLAFGLLAPPITSSLLLAFLAPYFHVVGPMITQHILGPQFGGVRDCSRPAWCRGVMYPLYILPL